MLCSSYVPLGVSQMHYTTLHQGPSPMGRIGVRLLYRHADATPAHPHVCVHPHQATGKLILWGCGLGKREKSLLACPTPR
jgi:hypothetical protein